MRRIAPYFVLSVIATVVSVCLSVLLDFSLSNTWQAAFAMLFIFGPLWVCGWKKTTAVKHNHPLAYVFARFVLSNLVVGYILSVALFIIGVFK